MICRSVVSSFVLVCAMSVTATLAADSLVCRSPDGQLQFSLNVTIDEPGPRPLQYSVMWQKQLLLESSGLGFESAGRRWGRQVRVKEVRRRTVDQTWKPVYGERSVIRDRFNEWTVTLVDEQVPEQTVALIIRLYDEGVALCYDFPEDADERAVTIDREHTEFRFVGDHPAWAVYSAQGRYEQVSLSQLKSGCERPLVVKAAEDTFVAIAEARLVDFARMKLAPLDSGTGVVSRLDGPASLDRPASSPWRVIMVGSSPGALLERNDIILNLNDPCALADTSWIRPGKVIREVTLTTAGGKACVDFAVKHGLQYVEFDAGWYGHEYDDDADATTISVDPKRSPGPLDLHEVIRYAKARNIGIILYVNRRALEKQLDDILPLYEKWGVAGVKYGFVRVGSQEVTRWLHHAVRRAADHRLMVDIHDEYRPTGYSRTYPNLMTQEGIAGDETKPTNELTLTILFTRMLAGAGDNTICYYDSRVDQNATHAYQLAKAVCIYSPWQFLYWYDRPRASPRRAGGAGGQQNVIGDEPELEFFAHVPTTWDDTRVLAGEIGKFAAIARRSGDEWFIGCMSDNSARHIDIPLSFLEPNRPYLATKYTHDPAVATRTHVDIGRQRVTRDSTLSIDIVARSGAAVWLKPVK